MGAAKPNARAHNFQDLAGQRFGLLTVEQLTGFSRAGGALWRCRCECGSTCEALAKDLKRRHKQSCGCAKRRLLSSRRKEAAGAQAASINMQRIDPAGSVTLPNGLVCLVDPADIPLVRQYVWYAQRRRKETTFYARGLVEGRPTLMHVLLMGRRPGFAIDHVNGDGLDNRRRNLRWATQSQNQANKGKHSCSRQQYKGVIPPRAKAKGWWARVTVDGQTHLLGPYETALEAALAYDQKARDVFGEFARTNFPVPSNLP
jgi:hypothetical protein